MEKKWTRRTIVFNAGLGHRMSEETTVVHAASFFANHTFSLLSGALSRIWCAENFIIVTTATKGLSLLMEKFSVENVIRATSKICFFTILSSPLEAAVPQYIQNANLNFSANENARMHSFVFNVFLGIEHCINSEQPR
jgi:hypothetical protein